MDKNRIIDLLEEGHISIPVVFLDYYDALGIHERDMMLLLHLHREISKGQHFPTPEQLARKMSLTIDSCQDGLKRLMQRGVLSIEQRQDHGIVYESYSLRPFYEKIILYLEAEQKDEQKNDSLGGELYSLFENEFGRPLSPMEIETLGLWIDKDNYSYELIKAALKEAVISGKLNLRYIDRILFEWQKKGITTPEAALQESMNFRKNQRKPELTGAGKQSREPYPNYNWLESD
ncbi:DnaD domain-containing protein [Geomicrobium sediminis]|uniref:DNA replication protein n=1 Tax=Geomicrobium sediminis TaxID=1347788 RepID=A0ABS2PDJ9_9BACL|nr:DnaD domain-containing protein [Geomicrobium sediminis]MBM7633495.1 DNA replication protein [Geomicrobium sediminis]